MRYFIVNWYGEAIYGPYTDKAEAERILASLVVHDDRIHILEQQC